VDELKARVKACEEALKKREATLAQSLAEETARDQVRDKYVLFGWKKKRLRLTFQPLGLPPPPMH